MLDNILSKVVYVADGTQKQWDIPFEFYKIEDVHIYITSDGEHIEEIDQNYYYDEEGKFFIYPTEESELDPIPAGTKVLILRETKNTQEEDSSDIYFKSKDIERGLDKLTMQVQDLKRESLRAVKLSHFSTQTPEDFAKGIFEAEKNATEAAAKASLSEQNASSSASSAQSASATAVAAAQLAESLKSDTEEFAKRAENAASDASASASQASDLLQEVSNSIYSKEQIDEKVSELENAQASAIAEKQDKLVAGANITIKGNVISATGGGGEGGGEGDGYSKEEIDYKFAEVDTAILGNADAIQKTRSDFMESDSELQQQIDALEEAVQGGGSVEIPDNVYTEDNLVAGENVVFEQAEEEINGDVLGSLNITSDFVVSGFSDDNVIIANDPINETSNLQSFEICTSFKLYSTTNCGIIDTAGSAGNARWRITLDGGVVRARTMFYASTVGDVDIYGTTYVQPGVKYKLKYAYLADTNNGMYGYRLWVLPEGEDFRPDNTQGVNLYVERPYVSTTHNTIRLGDNSADGNAMDGEIYLKDTYINVNGEMAWSAVAGGKTKVSAIIPPVELPSDVYRQNNLLGGKDIEIIPEPVEGGIDENTLACWHFDGKFEDEVNGLALQTNTALLNTDYVKFGTGSCQRVGKFTEEFSSANDFSFDFWAFVGVPGGSSSASMTATIFSSYYGQAVYSFSTGAGEKLKTQLEGEAYPLPETEFTTNRGQWAYYYCHYDSKKRVFDLFANGQRVSSRAITKDFSRATIEISQTGVTRFDEVRISKCIRWTEDFTPPTQPYRKAEPTGNYLINFTGEAGEAGGSNASFPLFYHTFADHILNDASWLRADTFSWHSGDVYKSAYEHLVEDLTGSVKLYAWETTDGDVFYTKIPSPAVDDELYYSNGGYAKAYIIVIDTSSGTLTWENERSRTGTATRKADLDTSYNTNISSSTENVGSTEITFYRSKDGHKIVLADQESKVSDIYRSSGVAWYYILDAENKRFKLPRTKHAFAGLRTGVGNFVEAGLPNITGSFKAGVYNNVSGAFTVKQNQGGNGGYEDWNQASVYDFDASLSNKVYGNSDTVQPPSTEQYLYFYVGNTVRNQTEVDVGAVTEQLNGKQDVLGNNVDYVVESYNDGTNWYRKYKSGWLEQGGSTEIGNDGEYFINFLKPFADTKYTILKTNNWYLDVNAVFKWINVWGRTTTSATTYHARQNTGDTGFSWYACGQGAF